MRVLTRPATTAVATATAAAATAAAAGGTAVRCCRVHVCSYTRGLTYARLAAYRPRRTRPRTRTGVTQGGGVVGSPGRKRRSGTHDRERRIGGLDGKREGNKEDRERNEKRGGNRHSLDGNPGGGSERVGGEYRLQSQENADRTRLRP